MFSERTDLHRSSRIPYVPGKPFAPAQTGTPRKIAPLEAGDDLLCPSAVVLN